MQNVFDLVSLKQTKDDRLLLTGKSLMKLIDNDKIKTVAT